MHAMGNSLGGMKLYTDLEDKYESYQGGFIWDYIDQALYKDGVLVYGGDFDDRAGDYGFAQMELFTLTVLPLRKCRRSRLFTQTSE